MKHVLYVLVFYFAVNGGGGLGRVIGPFDSLDTCNQIRRSFTWTTVCWEAQR